MIGLIGRVLRRLKRDRRGTLAIEMAVAAPVVIGLLLSGIEVTRYVLLNQKIERASATMADLVSQSETLSEGGLVNLFSATAYVMDPFDLVADGRLVVSSIGGNDDNRARINWQRSFGGGGAFGVEGGSANLPAGFVVRDNGRHRGVLRLRTGVHGHPTGVPEPLQLRRFPAALLVAGDDQSLAPCPWCGPCSTPYVPAHGYSRGARP